MKCLITGGTGFLGNAVARRMVKMSTVVKVGHRHAGDGDCSVDIRDPDRFRALLKEENPDLVIHCAAYRDPDFCEDNPDEAQRLNVTPVKILADTLPAPARLVLVSSDYVFDGAKPPYREDSERNPVNLYGLTKLEAEDLVIERPNTLILRLPLLFGDDAGMPEPGFLSLLRKQLLDPSPQVADDALVRYPTWTNDVAESILFLEFMKACGVFHVSGRDRLTRYGALRIVAQILGIDDSHIQPSKTVVPRRAARPPDSALATDKIAAMGFMGFTPFVQAARRTLTGG